MPSYGNGSNEGNHPPSEQALTELTQCAQQLCEKVSAVIHETQDLVAACHESLKENDRAGLEHQVKRLYHRLLVLGEVWLMIATISDARDELLKEFEQIEFDAKRQRWAMRRASLVVNG